MYLNITASKDTYIQNKILNNRYRCSDANVGHAGTLDLFKLYGESALPSTEAVNQSEVVTIVFADHDNADENLDGLYFTIYDDADVEYYVWFSVVGAPENDPGILGATGIKIPVTSGDDRNAIAATAAPILDDLAPFSATDKGAGEVELTVNTTGVVKNASNVNVADADFSVTVTQQGNKPGTYNIDADGDLVPETAVELSRLFVEFDMSVLNDMSTLDTTHEDFNATLYLYDILDGQMAPTNFNVEVFPLAQSFTEGIGRDTGAFSDLDICNFVTASYAGAPILWNQAGADAKGAVGTPNIDVYCSSSAGPEQSQLYVSKNFIEGTESFTFDVTSIVKEMLGNPQADPVVAPTLDNYGFRISFSEMEEQDGKTYFLKRFASRHALNQYLRPRLCISWNDSFRDNSKNAIFDAETKLHFQNTVRGTLGFAESLELTGTPPKLELTISTGSYSSTFDAPRLTAWGNDSIEQAGLYESTFTIDTVDGTRVVSSQPEIIRVELVDHDSESNNLLGLYFSITDMESSPGTTHNFWFGLDEDEAPEALANPVKITIESGDDSSTIGIATATAINTVEGLTAAVFSLGIVHATMDTDGTPSSEPSTGTIIDEDFSISRYQEGNSITLQDHIVSSGSITFDTSWTGNTAADGTGTEIVLLTGSLVMEASSRSAFNATSRNLTFSLLNTKPAYKTTERAKLRVFAKDHNQNLGASRVPLEIDSIIFDEMYYRVRDTISNDLIIPFDRDKNGTRVSTDSAGMYFELIMSSLFPGRAYTIDLLIISDGNEIVYECKDTRFRVDL